MTSPNRPRLVRVARARDPAAHVVFLLPRANKGLWPKLKEVLERTSASLRGRVRLQAIEDTIDSLVHDTALGADLSWYARMLAEKYLPSGIQR